MEKKKIEKLEIALGFLKDRLASNVKKIKNNSIISREMISQNPFADDIDEIRSQNKTIMNENKEILNLQLAIQRYILQFGEDLLKFENEKIQDERSAEEWFELTIKGLIPLNNSHPYINDKAFLSDLLKHYKQQEEYETCQFIFDRLNNI